MSHPRLLRTRRSSSRLLHTSVEEEPKFMLFPEATSVDGASEHRPIAWIDWRTRVRFACNFRTSGMRSNWGSPPLPRRLRRGAIAAMNTDMATLATIASSVAGAPHVPPQNLEAEESVLGAMLISPGAIGAVTEILSADDFYRESHGTIFRTCLMLYQQGEPVDAITIVDALEERGELDAVGGKAKLHELAALVPATANAAHYARIVREMATLRGLVRAGAEIARLGQDRPGDTTDLVDRAEQIVFDLAQQRVTGDFSHIEVLLKESFERIMHLYEAGADVTGVPTGFKELDKLTSGLQPGNLIIIAARPSMGKSALALCMAQNVEERGDPADDVRGGARRVAEPPDRKAEARGLAPADCRVRQADESADLGGRHRLDHDDGDPLEGAPAEVTRAATRADYRRLPAADDVWCERRESCSGGVADLPLAEDPGARPRRPDPRALAALARGRAAPRQAPDPLRPP